MHLSIIKDTELFERYSHFKTALCCVCVCVCVRRRRDVTVVMSSVAQPLPAELSSPGENIPIPDDCVSYTRRGDAPVTVTITCKGCRRVTGDPHHYCIRHLLEAGMPVCTRKSRCSQCADTDANFWVRYMKSYYGACKNMQPDDFSHHLSVQQYCGIPIDHRRRADGTPVFMLRNAGQQYVTPEKTAPVLDRSTSYDSGVADQPSVSTQDLNLCVQELRPISATGQVGQAIPPESLLSPEEQAVVYQLRASKRAQAAPAPSSGLFSDAGPVIWKQPTSTQRVATTPKVVTKQPRATIAHATRKIAYSPEHTAADYEQLELESEPAPTVRVSLRSFHGATL